MTKEKRNEYKFWYSPFVLILIFFGLIFFGYNIIGLIKENNKAIHKKEIILDEINDLNKREISLNENISKLETEEGKEEIIREKFPVVKQDEKMVTIVNGEEDNKTKEVKIEHGFLNWIKKLFKK